MKRGSCYRALLLFVLVPSLSAAGSPSPQTKQAMDEDYAAKIREYTTDERFLNSMVDHLPLSDSIPSPLKHFGQIIGAPGKLHYTAEIYGYFRKLSEASPRVQVRKIGETEEGRDMIEVILADEETLANLETYRGYLNRLADPRQIGAEEAEEIIRKAKPIYYITAGLHSPETGSPEMLMELAYRIAVEESPMIQAIRREVIFIFTPAAEPDGRDRIVDVYRYRADHRGQAPGLVYWGHYVAHDNNRDGFGLGLALTRNLLASYLHWKATVMHDLHESVPYLYTSTGLGPYNEYIDPITVDEWHNLAYEEVGEMTRRGMPGVWTHGFYNGWAANYLIWIANNHNAIGRFYETFGNSIPDTVERKLQTRQTSREWYRSNPPLEKTMWSLRNNTNYMQTGVLVALHYAAKNRERFVENFYNKSKRSIELGRKEAPYAFVIPSGQRRPIATANLVNLLRTQGIEVGRLEQEVSWGGEEEKETPVEAPNGAGPRAEGDAGGKGKSSAPSGSYLVKMDQPYSRLVRILLDRQNFPKGVQPPYDDTGWTLPYLHDIQVEAVGDPAILEAPAEILTSDATVEGGLSPQGKPLYLLASSTEDQAAVLRFRLPKLRFRAAEESFEIEGTEYAAGSMIIEAGNGLAESAAQLGLTLRGVDQAPDVPTHEVETPRVALVHTWVSTPQDAGWWHLAFDKIGIPYDYVSEQDLAAPDLSSRYDVIILPRTRSSAQELVAGQSEAGDPLPWKQTDDYRHIGVVDETDDVRRGMGYDGVKNLSEFVRRGGLFITEGATCAFPIDMAVTRRVSIDSPAGLTVRGAVLRAEVSDSKSPVTYGYAKELPVYFSQTPVLRVDTNLGGFRVPDWLKDEIWSKEVPRVVMSFAKKDLLMSGMLEGAQLLQGKPAVVDVPVGEGHVLLFANRPFWRWQTRGSHALVFNAMLHWNDLRTGWPVRPAEDEEE